MEFKNAAPIIGVVIGWALGQFSGLFVVAREERRFYSSSLPAMLDLYFQQFRINKILESNNFKLGDDLEKIFLQAEEGSFQISEFKNKFGKLFTTFETVRQRDIDLPKKLKQSLFKAVESAVDSLAKVDPTKAYRLSRLSSEFALFQEIRFPPDQLDPQNYIKSQEIILSIFRRDIKDLKKLTLRVAMNIGFFHYFKTLLLIKEEEKLLCSTPESVREQLLNSVKTHH